MKPLINWEALQSVNRPLAPQSGNTPYNWDDSADMYNCMAEMERSYTENQVNAFPTLPTDTVLDIGCGPGRITCQMAQKAKSVTALDAFPKMLGYCRTNANTLGLQNVDTRLLNWNEAVLGENIQQHDIVIASRSVGMADIRKLNAVAKKYAVVIAWANAPSIPPILDELFAGTNPKAPAFTPYQGDRRTGYNIMWNMVYDMGAEPNIAIVPDGFTKTFATMAQATNYLRQLRPFSNEYMDVFAENVKPYITQNTDGSLTFRRETRSFVLWWQPVEA